jgi:broad specificity phosphatase PhoE
MGTRLWLIRHGQTDWNLEGRWQGQASHAPSLNALGRTQANTLAAHLAAQLDGVRFDSLFSSDLARARETAQVIAAHTGLPVQLDPRLREINLGVWEGMLGDDISRQFPVELHMRADDPVHSRAPGYGESIADVAARMRDFSDDVARAYPNRQVLVVSHGLAMATLLAHMKGEPLNHVYDHLPDNIRPYVIDWQM